MEADAQGCRAGRNEPPPYFWISQRRRQTFIIRRKLAAGQTLDSILQLVAAPGCSEHHTGRALDLGAPGHTGLDANFARTAEFRWLKRHAESFGFKLSYPKKIVHGIAYEPWHWYWRL